MQKETYILFTTFINFMPLSWQREIFLKEQSNVPSHFLTKFWFDMFILPSGSELYFTLNETDLYYWLNEETPIWSFKL